ncbi:MAG: UDP-N-acetylglucosamine 1-carboxyvinyltransferase, partial [Eubacteriales bacterium]|nr:UDP-N-acetylglucosamine 1-carboxyvinyltransferase [Eubacteriales bacterium]
MSKQEFFSIRGGIPLRGEVKVSGGKNAAVAVIPAALLANSPCTIENLPDISDVHVLIDMLEWLGAKVTFDGS